MIRDRLDGEGTGHDWWHVERVRRLALRIAKEEGANLVIVELGALLHDVADHKFHDGDETAGPNASREWLCRYGVDPEIVEAVVGIVQQVSFKGAGVPDRVSSLEGKVVQDADRLDALGAIGIARTFAYGGFRKQTLWDPDVPPVLHASFDAYKKSSSPTINHFYEKLLLLKDRMHTRTGKRLAEARHALMERFLEAFFAEWNGEC